MTDKKRQLHGEDDIFREPPAPFSLPPMPSLSSARPLTASQAQSLYQDANKLLETILATPEPRIADLSPLALESRARERDWWRDVAAEAGRQLKAREEELAEARRQLGVAARLLAVEREKREENTRLTSLAKSALEPFATTLISGQESSNDPDDENNLGYTYTYGDHRKAMRAYIALGGKS